MPIDLDKLWVFRIIHIDNLRDDLINGLFCKRANKTSVSYISIGSKDVINKRDTKIVKCHPEFVVNDYVPFYFSIRTPMLFNIKTGHGVPSYPQKDIVYLCCRFSELACDDFDWCYTNGNAAVAIANFFSNLEILITILTGILFVQLTLEMKILMVMKTEFVRSTRNFWFAGMFHLVT